MTRNGVLLVDDEAKALKYFSRAFSHRFTVFSALSAREALAVLAAHHREIGVIVTDQRMPEANGVELLQTVRRDYPRTVRILTTAYSELDLLIQAINSGAIYSFVSKPWQLDDLERTLAGALEHHETETRNHQLLEQNLDRFQDKIREGRTYDIALIAAKIGHYVHNALCPVTLLIDQLIEEQDRRGDLSGEFLQNVRAHVHEIARTLKDLAQVSVPPDPAEFERIDLPAVLAGAMARTEILRAEKDIRFECDIQAGLPPVAGVPAQIEKLFRFMIAEEVVSLSPGSLVQVRMRAASGTDGPPGLRVEFEDFEPIRPNTFRDRLLHPFELRGENPREFGLFLASSYFIANHHGGSLAVRIKPNESLLFTFHLPAHPGPGVDKTARRGFIRGDISR